MPLLANTIHHLQVSGWVEYRPGCFYKLSTSHDRFDKLLVIEQITGAATATATATAAATVAPPPTPTATAMGKVRRTYLPLLMRSSP